MWRALNVQALGVDLLSLSAHKFYGPKGVGVLFVRTGTPMVATQTGGGQERGRRSGTENVAGAVGLAAALTWVAEDRANVVSRVRPLRDRLVEALVAMPHVILTGHPVERMPHHASFGIDGVPADVLLMGLDRAGIQASSGAACASGLVEPSYVLEAMSVPQPLARGALRLTLGRSTRAADIDHVLAVLPGLIERAREATEDGPLNL